MGSIKEYPNFVPAFAALGEKRLREIALQEGIDPGRGGDPIELATLLLLKNKHPNDLGKYWQAGDSDIMGPAVGLGKRADWMPQVSAEEIAKLPFYLKPSYEQDVLNRIYQRVILPQAALRENVPAPSQSKLWPELASGAAWKEANREIVTRELAASLGFTPAEPTYDGYARVVDMNLGITYVAIVGGAFAMGISPEEKRALNNRAKILGPDAMQHAKWIAKQATPQHHVTIAPFLLGERLLLAAQARQLGQPVVDDPLPLRVASEEAAQIVRLGGRRLASEAEWEYVARARGYCWLCKDIDPSVWIQHPDEDPPFGVLDLAWGEWVDDGWHDTYKGAPQDGTAWQPRERPEVARSGARAHFPWQNPGEELLLHAAFRERSDGANGVRFALDLPPRV